MTTTWILRTDGRVVELPADIDEAGAYRYAARWAAEIRQPIEIWYSVDDGRPQRLGSGNHVEPRAGDAPCRDIEDDRDRLYALLGDVAGALQLALDGPMGAERESCERILRRARDALS